MSHYNTIASLTALSGDGIPVILSEVLHPLLAQLGKTALHEAAAKGNTEMVAYMMEQVNPNVDARDVVGGIHVFYSIVHDEWTECMFGPLRTAVMWSSCK